MADSAHYVFTLKLPGVKSIRCQYRKTGVSTWVDFGEDDRIMPGLLVKYTAVPITDFEITTNNLFYVGYYGVTVAIPKDNVPDENAWIFTMPNYDVTIQCGASSSGGGEAPDFVPRTNSGSFTCYGLYSFRELFDKIKSLAMQAFGFSDLIITDDILSDISSKWRSNTWSSISYYYHPVGYHFFYVNVSDRVVQSGSQIYCNPPNGSHGYIADFANTVYEGSLSNSIVTINRINSSSTSTTNLNSEWYVGATIYSPSIRSYNAYSPIVTEYTPDISTSIQYILSPTDSGEVDGPETCSDTSFTFDYKIKTAYEFKRIRVFAVGEVTGSPPVPREESISDVTETYDGDTRTYTFTVSNIPDWAIGVRCVIETIYLPNDENASGTNTSDGPIGGNGTFDDTSDEVPLPAIPAGISAADSGFVTLFRPTITQLKDLGNYLWSNLDEFWENLQKIFTNPMDYIIGLNIFPVSPAVGADKSIYIGNWLTNISMPPVNNQFYEFDCGIRTIDEYFGSFLDYGPNTTARIMLPFIGDRDLAINEIMGKTLHLWYRINLLSGECLAALTINNSVYYQWNGNCAIPIPVTGSDWSRLYGGIGRMVGAGVGLALGGLVGMGIGGAMGAMATAGSGVDYVPFTGVDNQTHYQRVGPHTPYDRASQLAPDPIREPPREEFGLSRPARAALAASTASLVGHNIMGATPRVAHSGDMSGGMSIMGNRTPYIVLEYPKVNLPENYKHLYGYPSNQYAVLGNLAGYTECKAVMFESTTATDDEAELIIRTLKSGVYL